MKPAFKRDYFRPILSGEEKFRQGRAVKAALDALTGAAAVREFLNSYHPDLLGRPIDLAVASDGGLAAVEGTLAASGRP